MDGDTSGETVACFLTGQQAANLPVLLAARSAVLDRRRQIGGLFWSADLPPWRVHLFLPHLRSKSEASIWAEVSVTCTVVRPTARGF